MNVPVIRVRTTFPVSTLSMAMNCECEKGYAGGCPHCSHNLHTLRFHQFSLMLHFREHISKTQIFMNLEAPLSYVAQV